MKHPTFDSHGYPTDETLDAIENWPRETILSLFRFIEEGWNTTYGYFENRPPKIDEDDGWYWCCVTGGWSGNEDFIYALQQNNVQRNLVWQITFNLQHVGGYWEFHIPERGRH